MSRLLSQLGSSDEHIRVAFGVGTSRPLWQRLDGRAEDDRREAVDMDGVQVVVTDNRPDGWSANNTSLLTRWASLAPGMFRPTRGPGAASRPLTSASS